MEPILTERPSDRHRNEILLSEELDSVDDRTLRLKGTIFQSSLDFYDFIMHIIHRAFQNCWYIRNGVDSTYKIYRKYGVQFFEIGFRFREN